MLNLTSKELQTVDRTMAERAPDSLGDTWSLTVESLNLFFFDLLLLGGPTFMQGLLSPRVRGGARAGQWFHLPFRVPLALRVAPATLPKSELKEPSARAVKCVLKGPSACAVHVTGAAA